MYSVSTGDSVVKQKNQKKLKIIKEYLLLQKTLEPYRTERRRTSRNEWDFDFSRSFSNVTPDCPLGVPEEYRIRARKPNKHRGPRKHPSQKYPPLYIMASEGTVPDELLVKTYEARLKERPLIFNEQQDGQCSVFYGSIKGSDSYNSRLTDRINAASAALVDNYGAFYFLTFTYAFNTYGKDIVKAWKLFSDQLDKTMRALRDRYKMGYVCVLEATAKGYPHAHVILATKKHVSPWHAKLPDGQKITNGAMFNFIKKSVASPVFRLQKAGGNGLVKYLGKYISKSAESSLKESLANPQKIKKTARKALLSCLMPVLAQVRQYRFSIRDNVVSGVDWLEYSDADLETLEALVNLGWVSPEGDAILIRLLNNLTATCRAHAWAVFNDHSKKSLSDTVGWYSQAPPEIFQQFREHGMPLGCPGCIVTQYLKILQGANKEEVSLPAQAYVGLKKESRQKYA